MKNAFLAALVLVALGGCGRDDQPGSTIAPEPSSTSPRGTTTVSGSIELAPPTVAAAPRSIPLAITGMT